MGALGEHIILKVFFNGQDYPMLTWVEHQDEYLDEMLRLEGRGYASIHSKCGDCGAANPTFRCAQQICFGLALYCQPCIRGRHTVLPTHWIQVRRGLLRRERKKTDAVRLGMERAVFPAAVSQGLGPRRSAGSSPWHELQ
jgi:hypothetical protein